MTSELALDIRDAREAIEQAEHFLCCYIDKSMLARILDALEAGQADAIRYRHIRQHAYVELKCDSPKADDWRPEHFDAEVDAAATQPPAQGKE